uniref:Uncharacterized protein n=1 Tax=Glossina austeni TaxID=7395 RepID=A0A1A9UL89_GLOAU
MAAALDGYLACKRTESSTKIWSCTSKATKSFSKPSCFLNKAKAEFKSLPNSVDKAAITSPLSIFMPWPSNGNMARTCGNNFVSVTLRCSSFSTHSSSQTSFGTKRVSLTHSSVCSISGISGSLDDNSKVQMPALISLSACWFKFRMSPDCKQCFKQLCSLNDSRIDLNGTELWEIIVDWLISGDKGCHEIFRKIPLNVLNTHICSSNRAGEARPKEKKWFANLFVPHFVLEKSERNRQKFTQTALAHRGR